MQLITQSSNLTMSSREMAGLVEKRHDSVKRAIVGWVSGEFAKFQLAQDQEVPA